MLTVMLVVLQVAKVPNTFVHMCTLIDNSRIPWQCAYMPSHATGADVVTVLQATVHSNTTRARRGHQTQDNGKSNLNGSCMEAHKPRDAGSRAASITSGYVYASYDMAMHTSTRRDQPNRGSNSWCTGESAAQLQEVESSRSIASINDAWCPDTIVYIML